MNDAKTHRVPVSESQWRRFLISKETIIYVIIIFIGVSYLGLKQLDNTHFWDDEAFVGIMAKNFLATGSFTAWDGRNLWAYRNGAALNQDLIGIDPPLANLITAGSFYVFGPSTWAGRFPFVLLGLASFWLLFLIVRDEFGDDKWLQIYILGHFGFSINFLLYIRQCRNYALSLFLSLLMIYIYRRCLASKRNGYFFLLALVATLTFYSSYLLSAAFLLSFGCFHLLFHRHDFSWKEWQKIGVAVFFFLLATVPYIIHFKVWYRIDHSPLAPWDLLKIKLIWWFIRDLNYVTALPWVVGVGFVYLLIRNRHTEKDLVQKGWQWFAFCSLFIVFLPWISPQNTNRGFIAEVRHLVVIIPFLSIVIGLFFRLLHQQMKYLALGVFVIVVTTNLLTYTPFHKTWYYQGWRFQWLLPAFFYEVHHDYPTSIGRVIDFLNAQAKPDEFIFAAPDYFNYPLIFYTGHQFQFCCLLNKTPDNRLKNFFYFGLLTPLPLEKVRSLEAPLFIDEHYPDWFISFGMHAETIHLLQFFSRPHKVDNQMQAFQYKLEKRLDVYWAQSHRPELPWRHFGPKLDVDAVRSVHIFKRIDTKPVFDATEGIYHFKPL